MQLLLVLMMSRAALAWDLNDVSVLYPLPRTAQEIPLLLGTTDRGAKGTLLPLTYTQGMPQPVFNVAKDKTFTRDMHVIGVRFDPCFTEGSTPVPCRQMIRLIWQPVVRDGAKISTTDATLHTFYDFNAADFAQLIARYRLLLTPSTQNRLGVSARLKSQGLSGVFAKALRQLILDNCGEQNLTRATIMTLGAGENEWKFLGFNIADGRATAIQIPGVNATMQDLKTLVPAGFDLRATVTPAAFSRTAEKAFADSLGAKRAFSEAELQTFAEDILAIESPKRHNPGTIDCAACHMTEPAAQWARLNFPAWDWKALIARSDFASTRDVGNDTLVNLKPRRFRAFGYFDADPLIAQRTINESAHVADELDRMFP